MGAQNRVISFIYEMMMQASRRSRVVGMETVVNSKIKANFVDFRGAVIP